MQLTQIETGMEQGPEAIWNDLQSILDGVNSLAQWEDVPFTAVNGSQCFGSIKRQKIGDTYEYHVDLAFQAPIKIEKTTFQFVSINKDWDVTIGLPAMITSDGGGYEVAGVIKATTTNLVYYPGGQYAGKGDMVRIFGRFSDIGYDSSHGIY